MREVLVSRTSSPTAAELAALAAAAGVPVTTCSERVMAALCDAVNPQGILARCAAVDVPLDAVLGSSPSLVTVLAHVRDPGNLGSVLRAADAAGVDAVVVSESSVDAYNSKAVRASTGSLFHLPLVLDVDLPGALAALRRSGLRVLAADSSGTRGLDGVVEGGTLRHRTAWLFGNEAWGIPDEVRALADEVVSVPIYGRAESLNLAAAATLCMYASARAMRGSVPRDGDARYSPCP